jgi:hypothetical protein
MPRDGPVGAARGRPLRLAAIAAAIPSAVRKAVPDGASRLRSWWRSIS